MGLVGPLEASAEIRTEAAEKREELVRGWLEPGEGKQKEGLETSG
jgi:hypothetical protein